MIRRRLSLPLLLGPGLLWLGLFFVVPMYFMGVISLETGSLEDGFRFTWEFSNFTDAISDYREQFLRSFLYGAAATALALVIAYPLAYAIAFRAGRWKYALLFAVIAPFFTTYLIRTLAWQTILFDESPVVDFLGSLGVLGASERVLDTPASVIAGLTYNFLPFMILPIYANLERLDVGLIEAAKDLYSSARAAFWRVTLPLSAPGIVAGVLLTFIPAVGDYVNAYFLGGPNQAMIGNAIQGQYLEIANYPIAAALSFLLMALLLAVVLIYVRAAGTGALMGDEDTAQLAATGSRGSREPGPGGVLGWLRRRAVNIYAGLAVAYMLIPIAVIAVFSFNDPRGNFNLSWEGFTLDYWKDPFAQSDLTDAMVTSLELAALSTVVATAIGTLLALALVRHRFFGRRAANVLIVVPLATPEVVIGAALLSMFVYAGFARGFTTLLIAHIMFSISFVVIVVRSRLIGFDRSVEDAAADLGAGPVATFRTVTLPLLAPAIVAAALLAFALSIDDFVISNFNSGTTVTFPLYIFGAAQRGIPVEVNVLATMLFALTVLAMVLTVWQQRRAQRMSRPLAAPTAR
ncbi:MAG: ABC transporter permease subunit [Solirubrobacterales bacterium]